MLVRANTIIRYWEEVYTRQTQVQERLWAGVLLGRLQRRLPIFIVPAEDATSVVIAGLPIGSAPGTFRGLSRPVTVVTTQDGAA